MRYRRAKIAGATYFFTVNLANRSSRLLIERIDDLRVVVRQVRCAHPFDILAWVVMPEHIHALWRLPEGDAEYSLRWGLIKAGFSRRLPKMERISNSRKCKDAQEVSKLCGLQLLPEKRGIQYCTGFPSPRLDSFLAGMLSAGRKVAVVEQGDRGQYVQNRYVAELWAPGSLPALATEAAGCSLQEKG